MDYKNENIFHELKVRVALYYWDLYELYNIHSPFLVESNSNNKLSWQGSCILNWLIVASPLF